MQSFGKVLRSMPTGRHRTYVCTILAIVVRKQSSALRFLRSAHCLRCTQVSTGVDHVWTAGLGIGHYSSTVVVF
jgi:hypothetical protein